MNNRLANVTSKIQKKLLTWFRKHKRDLPWRNTNNPYHIWVSEIMLQQTRVETVIPYYERFLKKFPTVKQLAKAPLDDILKLWEGLGYYARARNLHKAAKFIVKNHKGKMPTAFDDVTALPGIGRYTAGAICSIAYGTKVPVLDGNVVRVLTRIYGIQEDPKKSEINKELWQLATDLLPVRNPGELNESLMELGAIVCTPRNPTCLICPVNEYCEARKKGLIDSVPFRKEKKKLPHYNISAGVIWKGKKILIGQRPHNGLLGGLWEFPGGKQEKGETLQQCLKREIKEEMDINVKVGKFIIKVNHAYSHFAITLHVFHCHYLKGTPKKIGCADFKWVTSPQLRKYAFPAANQPVIEYLSTKSN